MSKTGASFTVRFVQGQDNVYIVRNIITSGGDSGALMQAIDTISGLPSPDWSKETAKQPIIQLAVKSAAGYAVEIKSAKFAFDGTTLNFTYNGSTFVTASNDSRFQSRITDDGKYELKIVGNIASTTVISNKQITYTIEYLCNSHSSSLTESVDILIQQAGSNSYQMVIGTTAVQLDASTVSAILTAKMQYGTEDVVVGSNGYTMKWYQDGTEMSGMTTDTVTVTRDTITGGSYFVAKLYKDGNLVAQASIIINDIADEYQISHTPTDAGSNYVAMVNGVAHNATYILSLTKNNAAYTGTVAFTWQLYNSSGEPKTSGTGATVTVTPKDCMKGSGDGASYADCNVQVNAEFNPA